MKYIIDLHTHSIAGGHAYSTFQENVAAAYAKGLSVYGLVCSLLGRQVK